MLEVDEEGVPFAVQENVFGAEVAVDDTLLGALLSLFAEGRKACAEVLHHRQGIRVPHPGDGAQELVPKLTRLLGAGLRVWYLMAAPETPAPFQGTLRRPKEKTPGQGLSNESRSFERRNETERPSPSGISIIPPKPYKP